MDQNPYEAPKEAGYLPPRPELDAWRAWLKDRLLLMLWGWLVFFALADALAIVIGILWLLGWFPF
jgi:hypothetical protein